VKQEPEQHNDRELLTRLSAKMDRLADSIEKMRLAEYVEMIDRPRRLLYINFLLGIARGFGMAIGFTILAALVIYFLQKLIILNMPIVGDFIADIVEIVQEQLRIGR